MFTWACSGKVITVDPDEEPEGAGGSQVDGTGGTIVPGIGGTLLDGTGGDEPWVDPECPDEPAPVPAPGCDPLDPELTCLAGEGCYPIIQYPAEGDQCGHAYFDARCYPAGVGVQGEFCGDGGDYCASGYMCVVGAAGGKRCGKMCEPVKDHGCPEGLICGETDVLGLGVCF